MSEFPAPAEPTCGNCKFYKDYNGETVCTIKPPVSHFVVMVPGVPGRPAGTQGKNDPGKEAIMAIVQKFTTYPQTFDYWTCSEHKLKVTLQ